MPYSADGYEARAKECVRLANQAADEMVQRELLSLRQSYLRTAAELRGLNRVGKNNSTQSQRLAAA
jgi:hypothetical protein